MILKKILFIAFLTFFAGNLMQAQSFKYIGAAKCKMCHLKPEKGDQYNKWLAGPHAKAMETLATEKAKAVAAKAGVADPATDAKCVKCHSTVGHVDAGLLAGITKSEGVSCESCHGPGSMYKSASVMKSREMSMQKGLILPDESVCKTCHNSNSPTFKGFDFATYSAKIAHPDPTLAK